MRCDSNRGKSVWIEALVEEGTPPFMVILEECDRAAADLLEKEWIRRMSGEWPLFNICHNACPDNTFDDIEPFSEYWAKKQDRAENYYDPEPKPFDRALCVSDYLDRRMEAWKDSQKPYAAEVLAELKTMREGLGLMLSAGKRGN